MLYMQVTGLFEKKFKSRNEVKMRNGNEFDNHVTMSPLLYLLYVTMVTISPLFCFVHVTMATISPLFCFVHVTMVTISPLFCFVHVTMVTISPLLWFLCITLIMGANMLFVVIFSYAWTIVQCRHCSQHMGWKFTAAKKKLQPEKFWGLCRSSLLPALGQGEEEEGTDNWSPMMWWGAMYGQLRFL